MNLDLAGRTAVVTGASRGLGRAAALAFAAEGMDVVATARSSSDLEVLRSAAPKRITVHVHDSADVDMAPALIESVIAEVGSLDVLVNNAGLAPVAPFTEASAELWLRVFAVNVFGPAALARAAGKHFLERGAGQVINVASTVGLRGKAHLATYSASKGALLRMTEAMAAEWAGSGVRANAIAPGAFETDAQARVSSDEDLRRRRLRRIPLGRFGQAGEIGPLLCYLASPVSAFVTGATFTIDGGEAGRL